MINRMRMIIPAMLLLLAGAPLTAQTTAPCADPKTIIVTGNGSARMAPDRVSFTVGVVTSSTSVANAFRLNNEKTQRIVEALKRRGVKDAEIQTSNFNIGSPYDPQTHQSASKYEVTNSVTVTREDPKTVSELIQVAVDSGANSAGNLMFFNTNPAAARDRAMELAVRDARAQAEKLASAVGRSVGAALLVTATALPSMPLAYMNNTVRENITVTGAAPAIESGTNVVAYSVTITYEIK